MPFRPTLPRRCSHDRKPSSFLSSLAASPSPLPPAGSVPAAPTPAAYNALISAYSRAGRPDEVLRLRLPPTAPLFTTLISSLASSGHPLAARAAFASLLISVLPPTASVLTALFKSHDASPDSVYQFILSMAAAGCSPDAAVYSCLISTLCDAQRVEEALGVLDDMLENKIRPTVRSYTAVLRGYCEQGKVLKAEWPVEAMVDVGCPTDVISYTVLVDGLCRVGEFDMVERILEESVAKGWTPNAVTYMRNCCGTFSPASNISQPVM